MTEIGPAGNGSLTTCVTAPRAPVHCRKFDRDRCLLQNITFQQYSLHLWVWWRTHDRKSDLAYSKNLEGNALRETYPDLWHIHYFSETLPIATRGDWSKGGMAIGLQGTDNPVGLPNVCLFIVFITGPTHAKLVSLTSPCCSGWPCPMNTLKANNGPLDPGVGDERFFRFKRNAWSF